MSYQFSNRLSASVPQRLRQPRWMAGLALLGIFLIAVPVLRSQTASSTDTPEASSQNINAPMPVETIEATRSSGYSVSRAYTGQMTAAQASELGFERSGQLTRIFVTEGARVGAGAALAELDIRNLQTQRSQIEAERARAIAQLTELETGARAEDLSAAAATVRDLEQQVELQKTRISRRETLYAQGAISREDLDEVSFTGGSLQARLDQARSQLAELQNGTRPEQLNAQDALIQQLDARLADIDVTISKSTLYAPFSGAIAAHKVDEGTVVGAGQSVIRLVENGIAEAKVGVPTAVAQTLSAGEETTVEVNGEQYTATVFSVLPEVDAQTRTQTVVLSLEPRAVANTSPGQTVRLTLSERIDAQGFWVPAEALTQGIRGLWNSYVVMPNEETEGFVVKTQAVEVIYQEGDRVYVTGTLQPGDSIVANGAHRLVPGQAVAPKATSPFIQNNSQN